MAFFERTIALSLVTLAIGCSAAPDTPDEPISVAGITHGQPDRGRDPGVVALRLGTDALCSGTLIAPRAVLTARHCVSMLASEAVDCSATGAQVGADRDPTSITVYTAESIAGARAVATGTRILHPTSDRLCGEDIAIVLLDRDVSGVEPVAVDLTTAPKADDDVVVVGYGLHGTRGGAGVRERRAAVPIVSVAHDEFELGPSVCSGDSGGPALRANDGAIVGVVSRGSSACSSASAQNVYTRVDRWATLVRQAIRLGGGSTSSRPAHAAPSSGSSGDTPGDFGAACHTGDDCSSGYCIVHSGTCTMACDANTACPNGYACRSERGGAQLCIHRAS